ncbi:hypothetical protein BGX28_001225 [Mortierella sp. GBA30]|nr:hypothetical protein BGX28_001225 [Mortierella sp. GBA30]
MAAVKNKVIDRVISAMGFNSTDEDPVCPVFVVGDGEFGKDAGYQAFISMLKKKGLGLLIACCDEWSTSITCCQCGEIMEAKNRSVSCASCDLERDRDRNASHNMGMATLPGDILEVACSAGQRYTDGSTSTTTTNCTQWMGVKSL